MKRLFLIVLVIFFALLFNTSVQSKQPNYKAIFNLSSDPRYYNYVYYKSSYKFDSTMLMRIVDKRPEQEKSYNEDVQYFYDDIWTEPPDKMLGKIFLKELRASNMFNSVDFDESKPSLIMEIELTSLVGHYDDESRVARGTVKIHTVAKSPLENRIIMEKEYGETKSSLVGRFSNAYRYMYRNIGEALRIIVKDMVMDLENNLKKEFKK